MFSPKVQTFFVSEKIAKVRWVPEKIQQCERFLTGSWDMDTNFVRLWRQRQNPHSTGEEGSDYLPLCCDKVEFGGDISGLEFLNDNTVAVSCTAGYISLLNIQKAVEEDQLTEVTRTESLHSFNSNERAAPCTGIAVYGSDIATIGEDGCLNILNSNALKQPLRSYQADSIALFAIEYVNQQEVLVGTRMGVIHLIDIRTPQNTGPTQSFMTSSQDERSHNAVTCLTSHPMQKHVVLAGSEEGSITVWDLRQPGYPASYLSAHTSTITDIGFHQHDPTKLYTTAESGELWQWAQHTSIGDPADLKDGNNPWLNGERAKSRNKVSALITKLRKAVNCFDAQGTKIICGSDTEAVYFIDT